MAEPGVDRSTDTELLIEHRVFGMQTEPDIAEAEVQTERMRTQV